MPAPPAATPPAATPPPGALLTDLVARLSTVSAIEWIAETGSTNADLLAAGVPVGQVLLTDSQTAGRGRRGRVWHAPAGTSLMGSVLLRPTLAPASWGVLPLVAGTAVVQACRALLPGVDPARLSLKWPNDLLIDGVKAAGILVEAASGTAVVGIGINVDWRGVERRDGVRATSLAEAAGEGVDRWLLLDHLLTSLDAHVRHAEGDPGGVVQRYVGDCGTIGGQVIAHGTTAVQGTAVGLTPDGHLRIRADDGRTHTVTAGDVEHLR